MSEIEHAPGPWRAQLAHESRGWQRDAGYMDIIDADGSVVLYNVSGQIARLIAAAPEMLKALRAADAHALTEFPAGPDDPYTRTNITAEALTLWLTIRAVIARATTPTGTEDER